VSGPAPAAPLRVLQLLDFLRPGVGVPETLLLMVGPCRAAGVELHVAALHRETGDLGEELAALGVPLLDLDLGLLRRPRRLLRLLSYVRRREISVVHANEYRAIRLALALERFAPSLRVLGHLRVTGNVRSTGGRRERWLARNARRLVELVAVSQAVLDEFRLATGISGFGRVIFNGRPLARFADAAQSGARELARRALGLEPGRLVLVCAASLQASKDHATLLRAAAKLARDGPGFTLLLAGEGPAERELSELCASLELGDRVRFLGRRGDVPDLLACADLYVSSSLREGLPGSVIEAQASGLPCVVTRCGGPEEVVVDGTTGLVVPPGDADALARAVVTLSRDAGLRARMAAAARENARRFDLSRMVEAWVELYRESVAR
jgi:glycosyltransferase involved in cell wall biosynthesis